MACDRTPASTFAEQYDALREQYPAAPAKPDYDGLLRLAEKVATDYPLMRLRDHLGRCLRHTMKTYDPAGDCFEGLLERNLRRRLAGTLAELLDAYRRDCPAAPARIDCDRLLRLAEKVAADFPLVQLWDHLRRCLWQSMKSFDPAKGTFDGLFERNLKRRLRQKSAEAKQRRDREREALAAYAEARGGPDATEHAHKRWMLFLLDAVRGRLDREARAYLQRHLRQRPVAEIAASLGVTAQGLRNRFGGEKLARRVRAEVRRLVLGWPVECRLLLEQHLQQEVGLAPHQVERLLGVPPTPSNDLPTLEEEELKKILVSRADVGKSGETRGPMVL